MAAITHEEATNCNCETIVAALGQPPMVLAASTASAAPHGYKWQRALLAVGAPLGACV